MSHKLIVDSSFDNKDLDIVTESVNGQKQYYVTGPYIAAELINKNRRKYLVNEMSAEVERYTKEFIQQSRALGELNHPQSADVDLGNACHLITELKQEGNVWIGKSKVLSSPSGLILSSLLRDGVKPGMSSRALGMLTDESDCQVVTKLRLITVDAVADPSYGEAFVNGILENKQFIIDKNGKNEQTYNTFEKRLSNIPRSEFDLHVRKTIKSFLNNLKGTI